MVDVVEDVDVVDEVVVDDSDEEVVVDELSLLVDLVEVVSVPELEVGVCSVPKSEITNEEPLNVSTLPFSPDKTQKDGETQETEFSLPTWELSFLLPLASVSPSLSGSDALDGTI